TLYSQLIIALSFSPTPPPSLPHFSLTLFPSLLKTTVVLSSHLPLSLSSFSLSSLLSSLSFSPFTLFSFALSHFPLSPFSLSPSLSFFFLSPFSFSLPLSRSLPLLFLSLFPISLLSIFLTLSLSCSLPPLSSSFSLLLTHPLSLPLSSSLQWCRWALPGSILTWWWGGTYSGQVVLWDNRSHRRTPVQRTLLSAAAHTHPGTQNANNLITVSTEGRMCSWSLDMLSQV
uniref:Uncharacterized protein n=1 Tax=Oncorhynchus kisutch TaxID=8019 RepID=A0A8C7J4I3_ONCKI